MRLLRFVGGVVTGLAALALLAAWLAPPLLDWNHYRDAIARVASASLGRPVQIAGPVSLTLLPQTILTASGVTLPDAGDGLSADVAALRLQVALGPLLAGRVEARDLTLQGAQMRLPWPLRPGALQQQPPTWLTGLHARVEDGTLQVGSLSVSDVAGVFAVDPVTGTFSMDGLVMALGRRWRATARLGRAGGDGSAPLEASLDGQDPGADTGGTISGQLAPDGSLLGRVTGRGRDLSQLVAGPSVPWHAAGRFRGGDGLVLADDLDVEIGGVPGRGAVALRLAPESRLDVALAASRLDLTSWLPNLLRAGGAGPPTSIDLSAEAATLAGGTLRHVRLAFDLDADGVSLRESEAVLPGDATATLTGRLAGGRFTGAGRMTAPALRETLGWLQPLAPALAAILPPDVLQTASLAAGVTLAGGKLGLSGLTGTLDGSAVTGALTLQPGGHPALSGTLALTDVNLDPWCPRPPADLPALAAALADWPGRWGGVDVALAVSVVHPRLLGLALDTLNWDAVLQAGTLLVRRAALAGPGFTLSAGGAVAPGGHVSDARLDANLAHPALLAGVLPPAWPAGLLQGPGLIHAAGSGEPGAIGFTVQASLADLRLDMTGSLDLARQGWTGTVDVQHPGAPRLLERLGVQGVAPWLGDGSFSLAATLAVDPRRASLSAFSLSAGMLRTGGSLTLDRGDLPDLTGELDAENLPLPLPYLRSPEPLPTALLRGWRAQLGLKAAHVLFGLSPGLDHAGAALSLADGVLHVTRLTGEVAGGQLTGRLDVDAAGLPVVAVQGTLRSAALSGPVLDGALDITAGRLDASASLHATGFSPGALLATLDGTAQASLTDGVLAGLDFAGVDAALGQPQGASVQADIARALQGGSTVFSRLSADLTAHGGALALHAALTAPAGGAILAGTLDLPIDAADLALALTPARVGAPTIGLRLIGPAAAPRRTPELAALAGWLATR